MIHKLHVHMVYQAIWASNYLQNNAAYQCTFNVAKYGQYESKMQVSLGPHFKWIIYIKIQKQNKHFRCSICTNFCTCHANYCMNVCIYACDCDVSHIIYICIHIEVTLTIYKYTDMFCQRYWHNSMVMDAGTSSSSFACSSSCSSSCCRERNSWIEAAGLKNTTDKG